MHNDKRNRKNLIKQLLNTLTECKALSSRKRFIELEISYDSSMSWFNTNTEINPF